MSRTKSLEKYENIIVFSSMIAIVVFLFVIFGWSSIKSWICSPVFWRGNEKIDVHYLGTIPEKNSDEDYTVFLAFGNNTGEEIDDYEIYLNIEGAECNLKSYNSQDISAFGLTDISFKITTGQYAGFGKIKVSQNTIDTLLTKEAGNSNNITYRIKYLKSNGKKILNNTGLWKDIIIVVLSGVFAFLGFFGDIKNKWLRILFKILALPGIIVLIAILIVMAGASYSNSPEGRAAAEESRQHQAAANKAKASNEYKSAAHVKAACLARGDYKGAAYAQEKMDKSVADMIGGNGKDSVAFKNAAHVKAASVARGDYRSAAYAQAEMDKKMADIIKNK